MGKCVLSFDQIELITKKSDTKHSDNDWMVITWFVGDKVVSTDHFPLLNTDGSTVLDSGNAILPFTSEVDCHDNEIAVATFQIVNLGSFDPSDQVNAIGDIAESGSQEIAKIYMKEIELYLRYSGYVPGAPSLPGPLSDFLADKVEEFAPTVVKAIGTLFEDVIIPLLQDLVSEIDVILGHPNCNGEVLHDVVVFKPSAPIPDVSLDQIYEAGHVTGCGSAARTRVHITQHRQLDEPPKFDNTPPPQVSLVPSQSKNWPGTWAEDPNTPTPIITVAITPSQKAAGSYSVEIVERVDPRFNIQFQAAADPVAPHTVHVPLFNGNVMGKVRSWVEHPLAPTQLSVVAGSVKAVLKNAAGASARTKKTKTTRKNASARIVSTTVASKVGGKNVTSTETSRLVFKLGWQNSQPVGTATLTPVKFGLATTNGGPSGVASVFEANGIELPSQGVTLCVYDAVALGKTVGPAVRYIRNQNMSFTRADVMLVLWDPVH
ncbi:MAG TPA: hypothetical protein VKE93_15235 [Candidatus Angelobacter sp.]|nr:hypothetical protein [Candidatus Angelobacter sp.]